MDKEPLDLYMVKLHDDLDARFKTIEATQQRIEAAVNSLVETRDEAITGFENVILPMLDELQNHPILKNLLGG